KRLYWFVRLRAAAKRGVSGGTGLSDRAGRGLRREGRQSAELLESPRRPTGWGDGHVPRRVSRRAQFRRFHGLNVGGPHRRVRARRRGGGGCREGRLPPSGFGWHGAALGLALHRLAVAGARESVGSCGV